MEREFEGRNHLRALREERQLARLRLQLLSGVSEATIARAEIGGRLSRKTAVRLAAALGCKLDELLPAGEDSK